MKKSIYRVIYLWRGERYSWQPDHCTLTDAERACLEFRAAGWTAWIEQL